MKKKTGIEVDSFGEEINKDNDDDFKVSFLKNKKQDNKNISFQNDTEGYNSKFIQNNNLYKDKGVKQPKDFKVSKPKPKKEFNSIKKFNPGNNLIYDEDLLDNLKKNTN